MYPVSPQSAANVEPVVTQRPYRHSICTLAYVRVDHANGGIIRNLSGSGMAIQAVGRLHADQIVHLRFELIRPRAKFELVGQVTWADEKGQAGLRFTDLSASSRRSLMDWILTDLLAATMELYARGPVLKAGKTEDGLVMSSVPFQPIRLPGAESPTPQTGSITGIARVYGEQVSIPWLPARVRATSVALFVDALIVTSAVLLFSLIVSQLTDVVPSWFMLACTELVLAIVFALLYAVMCHLLMHRTFGKRLAEIAAEGLPIASTACGPALGPEQPSHGKIKIDPDSEL